MNKLCLAIILSYFGILAMATVAQIISLVAAAQNVEIKFANNTGGRFIDGKVFVCF